MLYKKPVENAIESALTNITKMYGLRFDRRFCFEITFVIIGLSQRFEAV